jgi:isoleucyl-tRNA synthetase
MLSKVHRLNTLVVSSLDSLAFNKGLVFCIRQFCFPDSLLAFRSINDFINDDLSSFYLDLLKDRLYTEAGNGLKRRSAQTVLYQVRLWQSTRSSANHIAA